MSIRLFNALAKDPVWGSSCAVSPHGSHMQHLLSNTFDAQTTMLGAVDISEDSKGFYFKADAPGLNKKDVKVQVTDGNLLTISGERSQESQETSEDNTYHRVERSFGKFSRAFRLPETADVAKVDAACVDGVLCVTIPKCDNPAPRTVDVQIK